MSRTDKTLISTPRFIGTVPAAAAGLTVAPGVLLVYGTAEAAMPDRRRGARVQRNSAGAC